MKTASIAIIGAGLAGLTAAYRLKQLGHTTTIYEARIRPGGRVHTVEIGQSYEELGGKSLLDGNGGTNILSLIRELGLKTESYSLLSHHAYVFQNLYYHPSDILKNSFPPDSDIPELCKYYIKSAGNLGEIFDILFSDNSIARTFMGMWARNFDGSDAYQLAPEYINFYLPLAFEYSQSNPKEKRRTNFVSVENGNSRLIETLTTHLDPINYDFTLKSVAKNIANTYSLNFHNGQTIQSTYVIFAIPCSTLRDVGIDAGIVPDDQMHAIKTLQYGTNKKILMSVNPNNPIAEMIWTNNTTVWFNQKNDLMTFYLGGSQGLFTNSQLESLVNDELRTLKSFYPSLDEQQDRNNLITFDWSRDKFSKGSYSNFGVEQYALFNKMINCYGESVKEVFRPVDGNIFFAGEHTDIDSPATMEGAVLSGEKAARMVDASIRA